MSQNRRQLRLGAFLMSSGHRQIVGTSEQIVDRLEERFLNDAADGFNIMSLLYYKASYIRSAEGFSGSPAAEVAESQSGITDRNWRNDRAFVSDRICAKTRPG